MDLKLPVAVELDSDRTESARVGAIDLQLPLVVFRGAAEAKGPVAVVSSCMVGAVAAGFAGVCRPDYAFGCHVELKNE